MMPPQLESLIAQGPERLPLVQSQFKPATNACAITPQQTAALFPNAPHAPAAMAGLLLRMGCWDQSHAIAQDLDNAEGSYWHAIIHRLEPDAFNARYWFRRVGKHPIFPALLHRSSEIIRQYGPVTWKLRPSWEPALFVEWCEEAQRAGGQLETIAIDIQMAEWLLLFNWCAGC